MKTMAKIKLLTAPYKNYNHFMQPVALGLIKNLLKENNIDSDIDDLYAKLYHAQKRGLVNLDSVSAEEWKRYAKGEQIKKTEDILKKIVHLTHFKDYEILMFSTTPPATSADIDDYLVQGLFRYLKEKSNVKIISSRPLEMKNEDFTIESIPGLFETLKELGFEIKNAQIGTKQDLEGLNMNLYKHHGIIVAGYYFYNGCPYNCAFCDRYALDKAKPYEERVRLPDPKNVVSDLKEFVDKYKLDKFMFHNTTVNPTEKFGKELAEEMKKQDLNIMWADCANLKPMSTELLDKLKETGCTKLVFGFETASKKLQKMIRKDIDIAHTERILRHCYEIGIWAEVTLLCGLPYETNEDIYETLLFIKRNYKFLRGINLNIFMMKMNDFRLNPEKYDIRLREKGNEFNPVGFDEINGMKWEEKEKYTWRVYTDILGALDPARIAYTRPVNHIFRVFSNNTSVKNINKYLESRVFNDDMEKIDKLINKYAPTGI